MKTFVVAVVLAVAFAFVPVVAEAQTPAANPTRVAVVFERSVRDREVLELAVQEALRDAGYQPVLATGVRRLGTERNWKRLPEGTQKVLVISDARVLTRRTNEASPSIIIGKAGSAGRIGGRVRWQKTVVTLDAKMVNVSDRALIGFGHGSGEASNLEGVQVSTAGVIDIIKTGGIYRQQAREDMVYHAAKQAATEAVKGLR